jgi:hypothetical protein
MNEIREHKWSWVVTSADRTWGERHRPNSTQMLFLNGSWLPSAQLLYIHERKTNVKQAIAEMQKIEAATDQKLHIGDVSAYFSLNKTKSDQVRREIVGCMQNLAERFPKFKHVVKSSRIELFFFDDCQARPT